MSSTTMHTASTSSDCSLQIDDLVRVDRSNSSGVGAEEHVLGKINSVIKDENEELLGYGVDLILGGKINMVPFGEVTRTTAGAEGLCGATKYGLGKRKRAVSSRYKNYESLGLKKKAESKPKPKPKPKQYRSREESKKKKNAEHMERGDILSCHKLVPIVRSIAPTHKASDILEKHQREFERTLERMEKIDKYDFFRKPDHLVVTSKSGNASDSELRKDDSSEIVFFDDLRILMGSDHYKLNRRKHEFDRIRRIGIGPSDFKYEDVVIFHEEAIDWDSWKSDAVEMCDLAYRNCQVGNPKKPGTLSHASIKIKEYVQSTANKLQRKHSQEIELDDFRFRFDSLVDDNNEACVQGFWRQSPFPKRNYETLSSYVICDGLDDNDICSAKHELITTMDDRFVGIPYNFSDVGLSESWMKVVGGTVNYKETSEVAAAINSDEGVIKAQVMNTIDRLLIEVQDKCMTEFGVLKQKELKVGNYEKSPGCSELLDTPDVTEQPVWGIDCFVRKNIMEMLCRDCFGTVAPIFLQKWLLPAINACPTDYAHDIKCAARILQGLPPKKDNTNTVGPQEFTLLGEAFSKKVKRGPKWLSEAGSLLEKTAEALGFSAFRVHPKGHGAIVVREKGIRANNLVTFYTGEVYPAWRWVEKLDAIEETQRMVGLKHVLADFYNMTLERPMDDPRGYGILFVDASRKAGFGSCLSHSCTPTCEVKIVSFNGELTLALVTIRDIEQGEELTFDYNAVTENGSECMAAVCLCGSSKCRQSYLHFSRADCFQQVMARNFPLAARFAFLTKSSMKKVISADDKKILQHHGFGTAAFGEVSSILRESSTDSMSFVPTWLQTFVAVCLRYIEYERRALPSALVMADLEKQKLRSDALISLTDDELALLSTDIDQVAPLPKTVSLKPITGTKPSPPYFHFLNKNRKSVIDEVKNLYPDLIDGQEFNKCVQKRAGDMWKNFSDEKRDKWKHYAQKDWSTKKGPKKAIAEKKRKLEVQKAEKAVKKRETLQGKIDKILKNYFNIKNLSESAKKIKGKELLDLRNKKNEEKKTRISYEEADSEGRRAMEQRVVSLVQTLSVVGRVLSRSRCKKEDIKPPVIVLSDKEVIDKLWTSNSGMKCQLLEFLDKEESTKTLLSNKFKDIVDKTDANINSVDLSSLLGQAKARQSVNSAFVETRDCILEVLARADKIEKEEKQTLLQAKIKKQKLEDFVDVSSTSSNANLKTSTSSVSDGSKTLSTHKSMKSTDFAVAAPKSHDESQIANLTDQTPMIKNPSKGLSQNDYKNIQLTSAVVKSKSHTESSTENVFSTSPEKEISLNENKSIQQVSAILDPKSPAESRTENLSLVSGQFMKSKDSAVTASKSLDESRNESLFDQTQLINNPRKVLLLNDNQNIKQVSTVVEPKYAEPSTENVSSTSSQTNFKTLTSLICDESKRLSQNDNQSILKSTDSAVTTLKSHDKDSFDQTPLRNNPSGGISQDYFQKIQQISSGVEPKSYIPEILKNEMCNKTSHDSLHSKWDRFHRVKHQLESYADILLLYAHTTTFLAVQQYTPFESTSIEVYARELGNNIPKNCNIGEPSSQTSSQIEVVAPPVIPNYKKETKKTSSNKKNSPKDDNSDFFDPDSVVTNVSRKYPGHFVFVQLLQWFNGGIGTNSDLPHVLGCLTLPPLTVEKNSHDSFNNEYKYAEDLRPQLVEWLNNELVRGEPWTGDYSRLHEYFSNGKDIPYNEMMIGSPILDLLVAGNNDGLAFITREFQPKGNKDSNAEILKKKTVDEGMPNQGTVNWVQCSDESCKKWRKMPWHYDIDLVPDEFFCKDAHWNPLCQSCDTEEDLWDEVEEANSFYDKKELSEEKFHPSAKFDIHVDGNYHVGVVMETDTRDGIMIAFFHFPQKNKGEDKEWISIKSPRILPFQSILNKDSRKDTRKEKGTLPLQSSKENNLNEASTKVQKRRSKTSSYKKKRKKHKSK
mmetsp:Transcript_49199/g.96205  ORF Transcript_49199/g.96205 Transcript_49199/m.96205 type:complete len:1958 (-) Transcript_49199:139-6012(-)